LLKIYIYISSTKMNLFLYTTLQSIQNSFLQKNKEPFVQNLDRCTINLNGIQFKATYVEEHDIDSVSYNIDMGDGDDNHICTIESSYEKDIKICDQLNSIAQQFFCIFCAQYQPTGC